MAQRTFEFTCYFSKFPCADEIDGLLSGIISELLPKPTSLHFLDDHFKERKKKFSPGVVAELISQGNHDEILSVIVSSKMRGQDNRIPSSSCSLSRISFGHPEIYSLSIRAEESRDIAAEEMIVKWCEMIRPLGSFSGFGTSRVMLNLDFDYGNMHLMHVEAPTAAYQIAERNIQKFRANQTAFLEVAEGRALRSIFSVNCVEITLFRQIVQEFESHSKEVPGKVIHVGEAVALWVLDNPDERRECFDFLIKAKLVFDDIWFDIESYAPISTEFSIPHGSDR